MPDARTGDAPKSDASGVVDGSTTGAPTGLTYSTATAAYTVGVAIVANSPSAGGGPILSFAVTPALPAGLSLSASAGVITGTPTVITAAAIYTVTATNASGSTTAQLAITVNDAAPTGLVYTLTSTTYLRGTAIAPNTPSSSGGAADAQSSISQPTVFPDGTDYVIRLDLDVLAASNGGVNGTNEGSFVMSIGDFDDIWSLDGTHNITGIYLGQETQPFGPGSVTLTFGAHATDGTDPAYAETRLDNLRVRKHVSPEPTAQLGNEELACP